MRVTRKSCEPEALGASELDSVERQPTSVRSRTAECGELPRRAAAAVIQSAAEWTFLLFSSSRSPRHSPPVSVRCRSCSPVGPDRTWLGSANSLAAGLMLGASAGLLYEGSRYGIERTVAGALFGALFISFLSTSSARTTTCTSGRYGVPMR